MAPPSTPAVALSTDDDQAYIQVTISNGSGTDGNQIQRRRTGTSTWILWKEVGANTSYRDYEAASSVSYQYRARAFNNDGFSSFSGASTASIEFNDWWIKDLSVPNNNITAFVDNDPLQIGYKEEQSVFNPIGPRRTPIVIKDTLVRSVRFPLSIQILGFDNVEAFQRLYQKQTTLLLQSPIYKQWYFVFGSELTENLLNTVDPYVRIECEVIEVERPHHEDI